MSKNVHPGSLNLTFVEGLYADYLRDPNAVPPDWQDYFKQFPNGEHAAPKTSFGPSFRPPGLFNVSARSVAAPVRATEDFDAAALQERVNQLIRSYRVRGHIIADLDPLGLPRKSPAELDPAFW